MHGVKVISRLEELVEFVGWSDSYCMVFVDFRSEQHSYSNTEYQ